MDQESIYENEFFVSLWTSYRHIHNYYILIIILKKLKN